LINKIVEVPFIDVRVPALLGLGIIGLMLVNPNGKTLDRIAFTDNELTEGIFKMDVAKFKNMKIPLATKNNFITKAIRERHYTITSDWQYLFSPTLNAEQSRFIQSGAGISCSVTYPFNHAEVKGALIFNYFESIDRVTQAHHNFMTRYIAMVQKAYTNLHQ
jgi:hypothetical protein